MKLVERLGGAFTLTILLASRAWAGFIFDATIIHSKPGQNDARETKFLVRHYVQGAQARMEIVEGRFPALSNKTYLVSNDGGHTVMRVDPDSRTYRQWTLESLMGLMQGSLNLFSMRIIDLRVDILLDEAGPAMHGFPTRHCKIMSSYGLELSFGTVHQTTAIEQEIEVWIASALTDKGFNLLESQQRIKTGNDQVDTAIQKQMDQVRGTPLKQITVNTTRDPQGRTTVTRSIMEITGFKREAIPDALFTIPVEYTTQATTPADKE
jgi:hypothetical protein